jgi:hypothetical protein
MVDGNINSHARGLDRDPRRLDQDTAADDRL